MLHNPTARQSLPARDEDLAGDGQCWYLNRFELLRLRVKDESNPNNTGTALHWTSDSMEKKERGGTVTVITALDLHSLKSPRIANNICVVILIHVRQKGIRCDDQ